MNKHTDRPHETPQPREAARPLQQAPPAPPQEPIKVRVVNTPGYCENVYRAVGDVFFLNPQHSPVLEMKDGELKPVLDAEGKPKMRTIPAERLFSHRWMERVEEGVPERITTARTLMAKETEEINGGPEGVE